MSKCSLHLRKSRQTCSASVRAFTGTTLDVALEDALDVTPVPALDVALDVALDIALDVAESLGFALEVVLGVACP